MHVVSEPGPVFRAEAGWIFRDRSAVGDRLIAGENSAMQEAGPGAVNGELEVAIKIAIVDALLKGAGNVFEIANFHDPPHLHPPAQPELDRCNEAEQAIAANCQAEQLRIGLPAALAQFAVSIQQRK